MNIYRQYSHEIREEDLLRLLREAASHGCGAYVVINGEYYTVALDPEKVPSVDFGDLF